MMRLFLCGCVLLLLAQTASASYLADIGKYWRTLYAEGGEGLYCGEKFGRYDRSYNIEHVFPMSWVTKSLRCGDRKQCRRNSALFNQIESDWHNMYPAQKTINKARGSLPFAELSRSRKHKKCNIKIDSRKRRVEPQAASRGEIARAMLYMADQYDALRLYAKQKQMLLRWHRADPPSDEEKRRNRIIQRVQGKSNAWID